MKNVLRKITACVLAVALMVPGYVGPTNVSAQEPANDAVTQEDENIAGDDIAEQGDERAAGDIELDVDDVIDLPMQLIDYRADKMLFEYDGAYDMKGTEVEKQINAYIDKRKEEHVTNIEDSNGVERLMGLLSDNLDEKTHLPVYKTGVIDWLANKVYQDMDSDAERNNIFFDRLRSQMREYADGIKGDLRETKILWNEWTIENYKHDIEWPTGGDMITYSTVVSKKLQSKPGENTYLVGCYVIGGTYELVVYGYNEEKQEKELYRINSQNNNDVNVEELYEGYNGPRYTFTIDGDVYPEYAIALYPTGDVNGKKNGMNLGNNFLLATGKIEENKLIDAEEIMSAMKNGGNGWKGLFDTDCFSFAGSDDEEVNWGWQKAEEENDPIYTNGHSGNLYKDYDVASGMVYSLKGTVTGKDGFECKVFPVYDGTPSYENIATANDGNNDIKFTVPEGCTTVRIVFTSKDQGKPNLTSLGNDWNLKIDDFKVVLGSLEESKQKDAEGGYKTDADILTCYDYAYYMLTHMFDEGNVLGRADDVYDTLRLEKAEKGDGYGFFANYGGGSAADGNPNVEYIIYDKDNRMIKNDRGNRTENGGGFFPLSEDHTGKTLEGEWAETRREEDLENYHYAMRSSGKFVYRQEDNMYFDFVGDDDVFLFINGQLVIDLGSAHYAAHDIVDLNQKAKELGLEEGKVYSFDFFYLERHTDFANMRVYTNIRVTNSNVSISKSAYSGEMQVAQGAEVPVGQDITYALKMKVISEPLESSDGTFEYHRIKNLRFYDPLIGVDVSPTRVTLGETNVEDLTVTITAPDTGTGGIKTESYGGQEAPLTQERLQELLAGPYDGYIDGTEITIYGFKYGGEYVYKTYHPDGMINNVVAGTYSTKNLQGSWQTQKTGMASHIATIAQPQEYFGAVGLTVQLPWPERIVDEEGHTKTPTPVDVSSNIDRDAEISINHELQVIEYTPTKTGQDVLTIKDADSGVSSIVVNVYDANKSYYVLDYGIHVNLMQKSSYSDNSLVATDVLSIPEKKGTTYVFKGLKKEKTNTDTKYEDEGLSQTIDLTQGRVETFVGKEAKEENVAKEFKESDVNGSNAMVVYTPYRYMDNVDTFYYGIQVTLDNLEQDVEKNVTNATPVMTGEVDVLPASVVYYEDNFQNEESKNVIVFPDNAMKGYYSDDISFNTEADNNFGPGVLKGSFQNNDNDTEYGHDDFYMDGKALNGTGAGFSMGSSHRLSKGNSAAFEFTGTGFDIISRISNTTGIMNVFIFKKGTGADQSEITGNADDVVISNVKNLVCIMSVNTYYSNGDMYQVPVISWRENNISDSKRDENHRYVVKIVMATSTYAGNEDNQKVYIDALRFYNPLVNHEDLAQEYYSEKEKDAKVMEIRPLIFGEGFSYNAEDPLASKIDESNAKITLVKYEKGEGGGYFLTGKTAVEAFSKEHDIASPEVTRNLMDYVVHGPNNELYLSAGYGFGFQLSDEETETSKTIQVALKKIVDKKDDIDNNTGAVNVEYLSKSGDWKHFATVKSATEIYYEISTDDLYETGGVPSVVLRVGEDAGDCKISFTNLKIKGYSLKPLEANRFNSTAAEKKSELTPTDFEVVSGLDRNGKLQEGKYVVVTFRTTTDVEEISIGTGWDSDKKAFGTQKTFDTTTSTKTVKSEEEEDAGSSTYVEWKVKFMVDSQDVNTGVSMVAYDKDGNYSELVNIGDRQ